MKKNILLLCLLCACTFIFAYKTNKPAPKPAAPVTAPAKSVADENKLTLQQANQFFAEDCFNKIWPLLENPKRTPEQDDEMLYLAFTSAWHWTQFGKKVNLQRGEWMIAHVYTVLQHKEEALYHANRCLAITKEYSDQMQDFDYAYCFEAMARASALNGIKADFNTYYKEAQAASEKIANPDDKLQFQKDLQSGDWFGMLN